MSRRIKSLWDWVVKSPEGFFLIVAGLFGVIFILLTPPLQTPDEAPHFLRAYQISQLGVVSSTQDGVLGAELPVSLSKTIDLIDNNPRIQFHPELKYDPHKTVAALHIGLEKQKTGFTSIPYTSSYSAIGYVPQAMSVGIGAFFDLQPILLIYLARLGTLCSWLLIILFSIRIIPYRKWTIAGLALLPMLIAQAGSPGVDIVSIGLSILFIASTLRLRLQARISRNWWTVLIVLGCLIALTKQTSILVVGLALLLRWQQFDTVKWKGIVKKLSLIFMPLLTTMVWALVVSHLHLTSSSGVPGQDGSAQLMNILQHPLRFPAVLFNTFFFTWGDNVITSFIGSFGWMDTPFSAGLVVIGYLLISFLLLVSYERVKVSSLSARERQAITAIITLYILGTMVALYLVYSPVNFDILYGLQGRYFLLVPFMLIPLLIASPLRIPQEHYFNILRIGMPFLLVCAALTIYMRFYFEGLL